MVTNKDSGMKVIGALKNIRWVLLTNGWCQKHERNMGQHCLIGAIKEERMHTCLVKEQAMENIESMVAPSWISEWNDRPGRTVDEVFDLIDRTISFVQTEIHLMRPAHKGYVGPSNG